MDELDQFLDSPPQQVSQDAYDAFLDEPDTPPGTLEDTVRGAASGIARGIPLAIDVPAAALASGVEYLQGKPFGQAFSENMGQGLNANVATPIFGQEYQPQTEMGKLSKGAGMTLSTLPMGGFGGGSLLSQAGRAAAAGAGGTLGSQVGGGIGQAVGGDTGEVVGQIAGGLAGGMAGFKSPEIGAKAMRGIGEATVPTAAKELVPLAQRAQDFGIPLSLDQIAPSKVRSYVQNISQGAPFSGADKFQKSQSEAWNKAVAKTLGDDVQDLTPESIQKFRERNSRGFDEVLQDRAITIPQEALEAVDAIAAGAKETLTDDLAAVVQKNVDRFKADVGTGEAIAGKKLASFRTDLMNRASRAQGEAKIYLNDMVDTIDDLAEKSVGAKGAEQLQKVRREYRNWKTIEPLLEKAPTGEINPNQLMQRVASSRYIKSASTPTGTDDLVDLARIGKQLLKVPGGSDTANKALLMNLGTAVGSPGAYVLAPTTSTVAGAGLLANRGFQKYINQSQGLVGKSLKKGLQAPKPTDPVRIELRGPKVSRKP